MAVTPQISLNSRHLEKTYFDAPCRLISKINSIAQNIFAKIKNQITKTFTKDNCRWFLKTAAQSIVFSIVASEVEKIVCKLFDIKLTNLESLLIHWIARDYCLG